MLGGLEDHGDPRWQRLHDSIREAFRLEDPGADGLPLKVLNDSPHIAKDLITALSASREDVGHDGNLKPLFFMWRKDQFDMFQREGQRGWIIRLKGALPRGQAAVEGGSEGGQQERPGDVTVFVRSITGDLIFGPESLPGLSSIGRVKETIEASSLHRTCNIDILHGSRVLPEYAPLREFVLTGQSDVSLSAVVSEMPRRRSADSLFVFGPLMAGEVLRGYVARVWETSPAVLYGFSLCTLDRSERPNVWKQPPGEDNVVAVRDEAAGLSVDGLLLSNVYDHQINILTHCEDSRLAPVTVHVRNELSGHRELVETRAMHIRDTVPDSQRSAVQWSYKEFRNALRISNYLNNFVRPNVKEYHAEVSWVQCEMREY